MFLLKRQCALMATVALVLMVLLAGLIGGAMAQAQATHRELTDAEKKMVEAAIRWIWGGGEGDTETALAIGRWLDASRIRVGLDLEEGSDGTASARGEVFLRPEILREPESEPARTRAVLRLASLLVHELVHARDQAPELAGRLRRLYPMDERRRASDWNDSNQSHAECDGPDAMEVEAYYRELEALLDWLLGVYDARPDVLWVDFSNPEHLQWLKEANERRRMRIEVLQDLIDALLDTMREANYEKEDWIKDKLEELDEPFNEKIKELKNDFEREESEIEIDIERVSRERDAARLAEVQGRLDRLFEDDGPFARARAAAQEARRRAARQANPLPEGRGHHYTGKLVFEGLDSVTLLTAPVSADEPISVELFAVDAGPQAPPGFVFCLIEGIQWPLLRVDVEGEAASLLVSLTLAADHVQPGVQPTVYLFGSTTPARWIPAVDQTFDPQTRTLEADVSSGLIAVLVPDPSYWDLPADHESYVEAEWLRREGIMRGMGGGQLGVGLPLKRAEFAALLVRALQIPVVVDHRFEDVPPTAWYSREHVVGTASAHRLLRGMSSTQFAPEMPITREQVYTVLVRAVRLEQRALGLQEHEITDLLSLLGADTTVSGWARPYMAVAVMLGLCPAHAEPHGQDYTEAMPREEAARALYRMFAGQSRIRVAFGEDPSP